MVDVVQVCQDVFSNSWGFCTQLFTLSFWFSLLVKYKYWIVVLGALIEGEIILMMAAAAAYHGHISLALVITFATLGAIVHDHALFFLGQRLSNRLRESKHHAKIDKVRKLLDRYGIFFVAMFRFLYGVRTITPIILGATHRFTLKVYSLCVCVSAAIWAFIISYLGYSFALMLELLVDEFKRIKSLIFYAVIGFIVLAVSSYTLKILLKKRKKP